MKIYHWIVILLLIPFIGSSQTKDTIEVKEEAMMIVEQMPEFPGGVVEMMKYLGKNTYYPPQAKAKNIQGRVFVRFVIEKDGSINEVKVLKGVHELLDKEAVRIVSSMPKWNPGKQRGNLVRVAYNLPIKFTLNGPDKAITNNYRLVQKASEADHNFKSAAPYFKNKKYKTAIKHYNRGIYKDDKHINTYYNRGICYFKLGDTESACRDWQKCKELGDKLVEVLIEENCK